ncbi:hypothetical protein JCM11957_11800 [Caminibacter profundus]
MKDRIYNPFDILRLFDSKIFDNYWWESGNSYHVIPIDNGKWTMENDEKY